MQVLKPNVIGLTDGTLTRASTGTYFDATGALQTAAINVPRINFNRVTKEFEGVLIEPQRTNRLLNSSTLSTQTVTVTVEPYAISFYGTGTIQLSGGYIGALVGNANPLVKNVLVFAPTTTSLTITVTGTVQLAQLEAGSTSTSYIPTTTVAVTRSADVLTGTNLLYSTLVNPYANWSISTTYAIGEKVAYNNKQYESLQNSNLGKQPDSFPLFWLDLGYDNRHASFDQSTTTGGTALAEQTFIVKPTGKINSLALINIDASVVYISATDSITGDLVLARTYGLSGENVFNWYDYFFTDPLVRRTQIVLTDSNLELYQNLVITLRLTSGETVNNSVGSIVFGNTLVLGETQWGASVGIIDYSKKVTDEFGSTTFVERPFSKRLSTQLYFPNTELNKVQRALYDLRATPCVWIATEDPLYEEALIVYGFYKDFSTTISYPLYSLCRLEIEGLT